MSYDLDIRSHCGQLFSVGEGERLLGLFQDETNLDGVCEITECVSDLDGSTADAGDLELLEEGFADNTFSRDEFEMFCRSRALLTELGGTGLHRAARLFKDYKWGQSVFSLTLPPDENEVHDAYVKTVEFARHHGLDIYDPQVGSSIDLLAPGDLPPMWCKLERSPKGRFWEALLQLLRHR